MTESEDDLRERALNNAGRNVLVNGNDLVELIDRVAAAEISHEEIAGRLRDLMSAGVPGNGTIRAWGHDLLKLVTLECPGVTNDDGIIQAAHTTLCGAVCGFLANYGSTVRGVVPGAGPMVLGGS